MSKYCISCGTSWYSKHNAEWDEQGVSERDAKVNKEIENKAEAPTSGEVGPRYCVPGHVFIPGVMKNKNKRP